MASQDEKENPLHTHVVDPMLEFGKQARNFVVACEKPNRREFEQIARVTGMGFLVLGALGFIIKLVHIPVNNILMS